MPLKLPTTSTIWEGMLGLAGFVLVMYKKEIQDWLKGLFGQLHARFSGGSDVQKVLDAQTKEIQKLGLDGLDMAVWLLLTEYQAQRVTVTKYEKKGATYSATCLSQALGSEMPSVIRDLQDFPVEEALMAEVERIHHLPGRKHYVPDAQLVDVAPMRDALISSGVWSAYYQSLPTSKGKVSAMLAISWSRPHPVSPELMEHLHNSGIFCGTVLWLMERAKKDEKS